MPNTRDTQVALFLFPLLEIPISFGRNEHVSLKLMKVDRFKVCIEHFLESGRNKQGLLFVGVGVKPEPPFLRGFSYLTLSTPKAVLSPPLSSHLHSLSRGPVPGFWTTPFSCWPRKTFWGALGVCFSYSEASWGDGMYWVDILHSNLLKAEKIRKLEKKQVLCSAAVASETHIHCLNGGRDRRLSFKRLWFWLCINSGAALGTGSSETSSFSTACASSSH